MTLLVICMCVCFSFHLGGTWTNWKLSHFISFFIVCLWNNCVCCLTKGSALKVWTLFFCYPITTTFCMFFYFSFLVYLVLLLFFFFANGDGPLIATFSPSENSPIFFVKRKFFWIALVKQLGGVELVGGMCGTGICHCAFYKIKKIFLVIFLTIPLIWYR